MYTQKHQNTVLIKNLDQNIIPPIAAGWPTRRKSTHFSYYNEVVEEFSKFTKIDSWLINPFFEKCFV